MTLVWGNAGLFVPWFFLCLVGPGRADKPWNTYDNNTCNLYNWVKISGGCYKLSKNAAENTTSIVLPKETTLTDSDITGSTECADYAEGHCGWSTITKNCIWYNKCTGRPSYTVTCGCPTTTLTTTTTALMI